MFFSASWLSSSIWLMAALVYVAVLAFTAKSAWFSFKHQQNAWQVAVCLGALLWLMQARTDAGHLAHFSYHLLGINLACLMLGAPAAFYLGSVYLLVFGYAFNGVENLITLPLNALLLIAPICVWNVLVRRIVPHFLPNHLFLYIFIYGFLTAGVGMLLTGTLLTGFWHSVGVLSTENAWQRAFPIFLLLSWGEAFLSGVLTAIFVAFKPQWLITFDDQRYLNRPQKQLWKD